MFQFSCRFLPNVIKIDLYNFEIHRFKVGAFFLRHSVVMFKLTGCCITEHIPFVILKVFLQHLNTFPGCLS